MIALVAATMKLTSGSLNLESGVGTQIEIASGSLSRDPSVVATKRPSFSISASCTSDVSLMCDLPDISPFTTRSLISYPKTR